MPFGMASSGDWGRVFWRTSLVASTVVATGTAAATAVVVWQRSRRPDRVDARRSGESTSQGISWAEIAQHDRLDNAWVVIGGEVYDVTPFIEDHPGGKLLLLAFAGRNATEPFETVGHSAVALRTLGTFHIGRLAKGGSAAWGPEREMPRSRAATLTGGRKAIRASGTTTDEALWEVSSHGFLPSRDPVGIEALHGTVFEAFAELAEMLPGLGFTGALRQMLDSDANMQAKLLKSGQPGALEGLTEDQLERAFSVVGYTMVAYWRGGTLAYSTGVRGDRGLINIKTLEGGSCGFDDLQKTLPAYISGPMLLLSKHLRRPPMIDYASTVLYNWVRIDRNGPITMSNIRCCIRLTGLIDEEWFFKTHVVIESEAAHAVSALIAASSTEDEPEMLQQLVALEEALWRVVRACLPIMYERAEDGTPKCSEHIFYQILRPLIKSGSLTFEGDDAVVGEGAGAIAAPRQLSGPSGAMSSLLPCIDAALGIQMTSEKLRQALAKFELSMPFEHRRFLEKLRGAPTIRQRILLTRPIAGERHDHYDALVRSFNRVISRVLDFRWQHWQYVKNFVMKPGNISHAVGSGGTTFDYLQQHITDTEQARLTVNIDGLSRAFTPGAPDWPPMRLPPVTYPPALEFWSVDGKNGLLAREPLVHPKDATWAHNMPAPMLEAFKSVWDLALRMPALCTANGPFVKHVEGAAARLAPMQDDRMVIDMSEAAREHLMTTLCHIASGCIGCGHRRPPRCIEKPLQLVARSVGRPPRLDHTELVLCNWDRTHPLIGNRAGIDEQHAGGSQIADEAEQAAGSGGEDIQRLPTVHVVWRFLAMPDEEWYRAIHIYLHDEARDVVSAIRVGHVAMRDQNDHVAVGSMVKLSAWLNKFCDFFDAHFEAKDSRTESVMIRRLEPFISHGTFHDLTWEETACWVYCMGSSVLLAALHAFLGVKMCPHVETDSAEVEKMARILRRTLDEGRVYMPRPHREFLESLERPGVSVRQYCFRRFGAKAVSVEALHDLEVGYNDALNALVRFLSRRAHLISRFFPHLASTFGILHSDFEASMRHSRLQLLKMRQRVYRSLQN